MKEIWRDIDGFPGYQVSNYGNVIGLRGNVLKWCFCPGSDYPKITLCKNGKHVDKRINILVATAFLDNPDNLPIVMHMDNDPINNYVGNLKWGTYSENAQYMFDCERHRRSPQRETIEMGNAVRRTRIIAINRHTNEQLYFESQHDAARKLGLTQQYIWKILSGCRKSTCEYDFEYADDPERTRRRLTNYSKRRPTLEAINLRTGETRIFRSQHEAARELGISDSSIYSVLIGRLKQAKGYTFKNLEEDEYYE